MSIQKVTDKKDFVKILEDNGYDKVATFLTYPNGENDSLKPKKRAFLPQEYIDSDDFFSDINISNGFMFVGLNSAERTSDDEDEMINSDKYQTMHDVSKRSHDMSIYQSIQNTEAYGSFAMDIMNKFVQTTVNDSWINKICEELEKSPKEYVDNVMQISTLSPFDPYELFRFANDKTDRAKEYMSAKSNFDELTSKINELKKQGVDSEALKDERKTYASVMKKYDKEVTLPKLIDRFISIDAKVFVGIIKLLNPKCLICFGDKSYKLASSIVDHFDLNVSVEQVLHYSYTGSKDIEDITEYKRNQVKNIIDKY